MPNREQRRAQPKDKPFVLANLIAVFDDGTVQPLNIRVVDVVDLETKKSLFKRK